MIFCVFQINYYGLLSRQTYGSKLSIIYRPLNTKRVCVRLASKQQTYLCLWSLSSFFLRFFCFVRDSHPHANRSQHAAKHRGDKVWIELQWLVIGRCEGSTSMRETSQTQLARWLLVSLPVSWSGRICLDFISHHSTLSKSLSITTHDQLTDDHSAHCTVSMAARPEMPLGSAVSQSLLQSMCHLLLGQSSVTLRVINLINQVHCKCENNN